MKDLMEDYINKNREAFDDLEPNPRIWNQIDQALPPQKKARIISWRSFAAAASVLLLIGMVGFFSYQSGMKSGAALTLAEISPELREVEDYYKSEIQNKTAILTSLAPSQDVKKDLEEVASYMTELKKELQDVSPAEREIVIQAMIENYRTRLEILERVINRLPGNSSPTKSTKNETKNI